MADPSTSRWKRALSLLGRGIVFAALLLAATYAVFSVVAARQEASVKARWAKAGMDLDAFHAGLAPTEPNATAKTVGEIADRFGLRREERREPWTGISTDLALYLKGELGKPGGPVAPPPEKVAQFLSEQAPLLESLRHTLSQGPPPVWEQKNENLWQAPIPNLLQQISLQKILAADALAALGRGDRASALADLEASWTLSQALGRRPELISCLITIASVRYPAGVLRRMDPPPAGWADRLASFDARKLLNRAFQFETCAMLEVGEGGGAVLYGAHPTLARRLTARMGRPYLKLSTARAAGIQLDMIQTGDAWDPCRPGLEAKLQEILSETPKWDVIGRLALPSLYSIWGRAFRIQMDLELTRNVLVARDAKEKNGGRWPADVSGLTSSLCAGGAWNYAGEGDKVSIRYSLTPDLPLPKAGSTAPVLPTFFEEEAAAPTTR